MSASTTKKASTKQITRGILAKTVKKQVEEETYVSLVMYTSLKSMKY